MPRKISKLKLSATLPPVRILSHYFVARFLGLFSTILVGALILVATVELVLNLDDMASFGHETPSVFRYLWVRLASYYLSDLLPIASFLAAFVAFAWAGRSLELVAVEAGGIRLLRVIAPVLATALILSFATAILHETLILHADRIWSTEARSGHDEIDFGRRAFWHHRGRTFTNITEADPVTRTLHGVEIFERGAGGSIVRVIRADRVRIELDGLWQIENASIWTFDPKDAARLPRHEEGVWMALDLDSLGGDSLLGADPGLLPLPVLARYLAEQPHNRTASDLRRLQQRYHQRLSSPWLVLAFALLALPFALRVDATGHLGRPAAEAVAMLGAFFLLRTAGETLAMQELFPLGITPWASIALFSVWAGWLLQRHRI
ncbi:MAG: LptF/LptG family permease [Deltaproteobacteria bacterium]|jgi:lipopolysaccharide export system permease protein|nr:LptF/LptG family permease [Deltaproteobacteria bacterium]MBW2497999.1 LptF/LptG family permease [Deltaproteobacteria bacterium]